jgi:hypothetical protein
MQGLSCYVPITFDREFTCLTAIGLHCYLSSFKFRAKHSAQDFASYTDNGIKVVSTQATKPANSTLMKQNPKLSDYLFDGSMNN